MMATACSTRETLGKPLLRICNSKVKLLHKWSKTGGKGAEDHPLSYQGGNLTMADLNAYTADWLPGLEVRLARCQLSKIHHKNLFCAFHCLLHQRQPDPPFGAAPGQWSSLGGRPQHHAAGLTLPFSCYRMS